MVAKQNSTIKAKILFQVTENILLPNLIEANSEQRNDASVTHQKP